MTYPAPENEQARLETLRSYELLDTPPEQPYERLVQVTRRILDVPVAAFCLMDGDRQWVKAVDGGDFGETRREYAFCNYTVARAEMLTVFDASSDPRFQHNPFVTGDPGVRAYAGMPVRGHDGSVLGTLLVMDTAPRRFSQYEQACLGALAERLEEHLELRRLALQLQEHRERGGIDDQRADELDALWKVSGELLLQELDELERESTAANWRVDPEHTMTFGEAVTQVVSSFDLAKQMALNFRHLGWRRDGGFDLISETFDPEALSRFLPDKFECRFDKQGRSLLVEDRTRGFEIRGDLGVLRRVLEHLVDNAVAYSPVSTDVRIEFQSDGDWLTVYVFDRGPGPSKRTGDHIFEENTAGQRLIDSGPPGPRRGEGLSYVQAAIEAHGGLVGYEHREPTGCIFWFCVPSNPLGLPVDQ